MDRFPLTLSIRTCTTHNTVKARLAAFLPAFAQANEEVQTRLASGEGKKGMRVFVCVCGGGCAGGRAAVTVVDGDGGVAVRRWVGVGGDR